jgi:hypothetical protein
LDASGLVGKNLKDENNRDIGRITSFLIDSSGRIDEVLVENAHGNLNRFPVDTLKIDQAAVALISNIDTRIEAIAERLPIITKKRRVLDKLSENKVIPPEIYQNLCKEFDKALRGMRKEAQNLLEDMDKKAEEQEDYIGTLQMSRTFLEIEREMGTVKNEVYQRSLMSILNEIKNARQRKLTLLGIKDKISSILMDEEEEIEEEPEAEPAPGPQLMPAEREPTLSNEPSAQGEAIPVRMTQD